MGFWTFLQRTKRIQGIFKKKTADSVVEGGGNKRGGGVFLQNLHFLPPPSFKTGKGIGGGRTGRRRRLPALPGMAGIREWGKMGWRPRRFDSHLGLGRREEVAPQAATNCRRWWLGVATFEV
jgi:hypothetical protein